MALQRIEVHRHHHRHHHHHHHHHNTACRLLGLVTCSGPTNSRELFRGVTFGFVSHTADISQLTLRLPD